MKVNEWFQKIREKANLRREETEVRENKAYAVTFAIVGVIAGMVVCTLLVILQFIVSDYKTLDVLGQTIMNVVFVILLAYIVWMLLPVYKSGERTIIDKVLTTLLALVCVYVPYTIGIYLAMFFFIALVVLIALFVFGKLVEMWTKDSTRSFSRPSRPSSSGPEKFKLDDGTVVTDTGFGSYSGNDGHSYDRGYGDTFTRKD